MWKKIMTVGLILTVATPTQAAGFERLFAGFEKGCEMNSKFWDFHISLVRPEKNPGSGSFYLPGNPRLPKGIQGSLGRVKLNLDGDGTKAKIPLRGNFYNLPVVEYTGWFGNENGISRMSFTINAPISTVQNVLKQKGIRITSLYSEGPGRYIRPILSSDGNRTQITCDRSS